MLGIKLFRNTTIEIAPGEYEFGMAAVVFLKEGGTVDRAIELVRQAAERLSKEGQTARAGNGQSSGADLRQTIEGEAGQLKFADDGHDENAPSPSSNASGEGLRKTASDGQRGVAPPAREPTPSQIEAIDKHNTAKALDVFDRTLTHTGRRWGNVQYGELSSLTEDGELARLIKTQIGTLRGNDRHKNIRVLMTPMEFHAVLRKLKGGRHAA